MQSVRVESWSTNLHLNVVALSVEEKANSAVPSDVSPGPLVMVVSGGVVSAASARSSVIATNANRASNGTNRIRRFLNRAPPLFYRIPQYALFSAKPSR